MVKVKETTRLCALTREETKIEDLIRFAVSPDEEIAPDVDGKAPGRGVWVTLSYEAVEQAQHKKVFARSLKTQVVVPADLAKLTKTRLEQRLSGTLGLARKAGAIVTGAAKVAALVEKGGAAALITAADGAADSRRKMLQSVRRSGNEGTLMHIESLTSDQLGAALGMDNVIHAALVPGAAAKSVIERARRLDRFRTTERKEDSTI